jgi:hypothetical protein
MKPKTKASEETPMVEPKRVLPPEALSPSAKTRIARRIREPFLPQPTSGAKLKRTQISLSEEDRALVLEIASRKGVSMSQVIREAIRQYAVDQVPDDPWERLMDVVGIIDTGDPSSSIDHDKVIYG